MAEPHSPRTRRIVQAAAELFLQQGYAVNMAEVARRAEVSKQTVYSHFGTKATLCTAAIQHLIAPTTDVLSPDGPDLTHALLQFATLHLERALDPQTTALSRHLIGEAGRFPEAARELYGAGLDSVRRALAERLARAAQAGELTLPADDPALAAELLLGLLHGLDTDRRRLGVPVRTGAERQHWVQLAVDLFLRACAPSAVSSARLALEEPV